MMTHFNWSSSGTFSKYYHTSSFLLDSEENCLAEFQKGGSCVPDSLFLGSWMSPPFQRISALPVLSALYFLLQCLSGWLVQPNHSENVQHLSSIIKAESSVGSRPVV